MQNPLDPGYYCSEELRRFGFKAVGRNVRISKLAHVHGADRVEIGSNVRIDAFAVLVASGGYIRLGSHIHIGSDTLLGARGGIVLEDFAGLSHGCKILSASDDFSGSHLTGPMVPASLTDPRVAPVTVGRHVVIGSNSVILPGVTIGEGAAVGAMSLVTRSIPAWEIHCGTPATKHSERSRRLKALEAMIDAPVAVAR
jgi:galactoside O-acetyltransferase